MLQRESLSVMCKVINRRAMNNLYCRVHSQLRNTPGESTKELA
jgi:hypothetical protein